MDVLATAKNSKIVPIAITVGIVIGLGVLGYLLYASLTDESEPIVVEGSTLDTAALDNEALDNIQYVAGTAPEVSTSDLGRDNPFIPF
ncbi:hypothetical protein ACFL2D_00380 [Patescibacteria group bacterium]